MLEDTTVNPLEQIFTQSMLPNGIVLRAFRRKHTKEELVGEATFAK